MNFVLCNFALKLKDKNVNMKGNMFYVEIPTLLFV